MFPRPMKITQPPEPEAFDKLLTWLDPDREKAGDKYQKLHLRLSRIFAAKGLLSSGRPG
jgi:hypothetical protein